MKIKYQFVTGETKEIETDENIYKESKEIDRQIYNNNQRNTRRHQSLDLLTQYDLEPVDESDTLQEQFFRYDEFEKLIAPLTDDQKDLVRRVFFDGELEIDIAREQGVDKSAISHRMKRIYERIKKSLQ